MMTCGVIVESFCNTIGEAMGTVSAEFVLDRLGLCGGRITFEVPGVEVVDFFSCTGVCTGFGVREACWRRPFCRLDIEDGGRMRVLVEDGI
jgi:hypothetical protein